MSMLSHPKDVCDDMSVWKWNGSYRRWLSVDERGLVKTLGKTEAPSPPHYHTIWKRCYENKSSQDLKKIVVTLEVLPLYYTFHDSIYRTLRVRRLTVN